jgi:hypothetical protein
MEVESRQQPPNCPMNFGLRLVPWKNQQIPE